MNYQFQPAQRMVRKTFLSLGCLVATGLVFAQASIQSISSTIQGGVEIVRIDLSEPLTAPPAGFVVQSPARIALDFPGVSSGLASGTVELNQGNLRVANVAQTTDRTRVVLNLNRPTGYRTELQGRSILISLEPAPTPAGLAAVTSTNSVAQIFSENRNDAALPLKDIDFRRGG